MQNMLNHSWLKGKNLIDSCRFRGDLNLAVEEVVIMDLVEVATAVLGR